MIVHDSYMVSVLFFPTHFEWNNSKNNSKHLSDEYATPLSYYVSLLTFPRRIVQKKNV